MDCQRVGPADEGKVVQKETSNVVVIFVVVVVFTTIIIIIIEDGSDSVAKINVHHRPIQKSSQSWPVEMVVARGFENLVGRCSACWFFLVVNLPSVRNSLATAFGNARNSFQKGFYVT